MITIHSLFDWLLEPIFEKLPRKDRLICKMVCQRWYRILMESRKFRDDRHIYLKRCLINVNQAPASVFMNAVFPYEILTVGSWIKFESHQDLNQFAEHLGSSVTEVVFKHEFTHLFAAFQVSSSGGSATEMVFDGSSKEKSEFQILNQMPLLKSLTTHYYSLEEIATNLTYIREDESGLMNLDVLNIQTYCTATEELKQNLKKIKLFIKNNVKIILEKVILDENSSIENILSVFEITKINHLDIYTAGKSNEEMEKLLKVNSLDCESVKFICPPTKSPYPYLETFSNAHPNVKEFKLDCYFLPPKIELPRLTALLLRLSMPVQSLKSLETLTNLKFLRIDYVYNDDIYRCRFGHDAVNLPNLKELCLGSGTLRGIQVPCPECIEALFHSFKNLSKFTVDANNIDLSIDGEMIPFDDNIFDKLNEPRFALEEMNIKNREMTLTVNVVTKLLNVLPNLRSVTFYATDTLNFNPSFQSVVQSVFGALKQLTHLSFECYDEFNMEPSEIPLIVEDLETCGYPVQDLPTLMTSVEQLNNRGYKMSQFKLNINHDDNTSKIELMIVRRFLQSYNN